MRSRIIPSISTLVAFALLLTACTFTARNDDTIPTRPDRRVESGTPRGRLASNALVPFDACDTFLDYVISHGVELVGPYGLGDGFMGWPVEEGATTTMAAAGAAPAVGQDTDRSTTNVQVVGVDEPDMVKTDGRPHRRPLGGDADPGRRHRPAARGRSDGSRSATSWCRACSSPETPCCCSARAGCRSSPWPKVMP